jgi:hypothetical protein
MNTPAARYNDLLVSRYNDLLVSREIDADILSIVADSRVGRLRTPRGFAPSKPHQPPTTRMAGPGPIVGTLRAQSNYNPHAGKESHKTQALICTRSPRNRCCARGTSESSQEGGKRIGGDTRPFTMQPWSARRAIPSTPNYTEGRGQLGSNRLSSRYARFAQQRLEVKIVAFVCTLLVVYTL